MKKENPILGKGCEILSYTREKGDFKEIHLQIFYETDNSC